MTEPPSTELPQTLEAVEAALAVEAAKVERIRQYNPTVTFRPNAVQKRILNMLANGIDGGCRSFGILTGNRTGKTTCLANLIWNIAAGPQNDYFELPFIQKWPFANRELRLVCDRSDILEQSGGLWQAIHQWWPRNGYRARQQGYDHESMYELPNGFTLSVRRPDQPSKVHESNTLSGVFFNEPPESPMVWQQYGVRLSGTGFRSMWGTVWKSDMAWVGEEIIDNPLSQHLFADIHECCRDCFPDGHMSHKQIEALIADFPEDQREARTSGRFNNLSVRVFQLSREDNFYEGDDPENLQCYASLDPHPHKPWVYVVGGLDELNNWWILDEWPTEFPYHKIRGDNRGLADYAAIIRRCDSTWHVKDRVIDRRGSGQSIRRDYGVTTVRIDLEREHRLRFRDGNPHVQDDGNEIGGVTAIKNLLRHDPDKGLFTKLHVSRRCRNLRYQLEKLSKLKDPATGRPTEKIDDEFLDFPRALMYLVMAGFKYRTGLSDETIRRNKMSSHEREIYRRLNERGGDGPRPSQEATPINWFN